MDEEGTLLLNSLRNGGVSIPSDISSIRELDPASLVSICAQCLNLLDETASFPTRFPDSLVDKFKICTDIALAIKKLGYTGDMTYNKFLYPAEDDLYKLVRFMVEKLPESSDGVKVPYVNGIKEMQVDDSSNSLEDYMEKADRKGLDINDHRQKLKELDLHDAEEPELSGSNFEDVPSTASFSNGKPTEQGDDEHFLKVASADHQTSEMRNEIKALQYQEKVLMNKVAARSFEIQKLEEEFQLLKAAAEMAFDDQHPVDFEQLSNRVDSRKRNLMELESEWDAFRKPLEEKRLSLEESLYGHMPEVQDKLQKLREAELEKKSILSEIRKRVEEHSKLCLDYENQAELPSRASYIERIKEITKNSRKQDADIERILKDTRKLQLESNTIQDRLHRTYAVLDEMVFREAKKEPVGRQAYRLLTSLHECFEQISEKILMTDRIRREMAEHEKKLTAMASRSVDMNKLQADLDAIREENEKLEHKKLDN